VLACILVVPFAVVPGFLGWPRWTSWIAPIAYFGALVLLVELRLIASHRWQERRG
jgi:hypothetical protein